MIKEFRIKLLKEYCCTVEMFDILVRKYRLIINQPNKSVNEILIEIAEKEGLSKRDGTTRR